MAGGKRIGAGRPVGSKIKNPKVQIGARICPKLAEWLKKQRNKSRVIETALIEYKARLESES